MSENSISALMQDEIFVAPNIAMSISAIYWLFSVSLLYCLISDFIPAANKRICPNAQTLFLQISFSLLYPLIVQPGNSMAISPNPELVMNIVFPVPILAVDKVS